CNYYTCIIIICRYAKDILQKEMLPHVGVGQYCETDADIGKDVNRQFAIKAKTITSGHP
ncbi:hypothetical protein A2U01_0067695, partial [Trifolium medium]|nr:hypothetical protein [Trifolium medium]